MLQAERETTIGWDAATKKAKIWTNDPEMIEKMDKLVAESAGAYVCKSRMGQSANYECDSRLITLRTPTVNDLRRDRAEKALEKNYMKPGRPRKIPASGKE